jgi:hypothetical protein
MNDSRFSCRGFRVKEELLFVNKKKQKILIHWAGGRENTAVQFNKGFFGHFFPKR